MDSIRSHNDFRTNYSYKSEYKEAYKYFKKCDELSNLENVYQEKTPAILLRTRKYFSSTM